MDEDQCQNSKGMDLDWVTKKMIFDKSTSTFLRHQGDVTPKEKWRE